MTNSEADASAHKSWLEAISPAERRELLRIDPLRSWASLLTNWGLVFGAMAMVAWAPNPITIVLALFIIGARQLGFAIIMHEASHRTLFASRTWNDLVGNWLASYPVWLDMAAYRRYHLTHHAKTGTLEDPDIGLAAPFPITPESFRRKVWRDLSGQTGVKQARLVFLRDIGKFDRARDAELGMNRGERNENNWRKLIPVFASNAVLLGILTLAGHPALYLLWVGAWLTTYRLVTRIRSIAEHGMVPDGLDPLQNTRTTRARWWERLLIAPNFVNFHLEHHLMMTVPHGNLARFHELLRERGVLDRACLADGYVEVLKLATSRAATN